MSESDIFRPNDLLESARDDLEPWQILVAACHFGPAMGDCVELDYTYRFDGESIHCIGVGRNKADVCLDGDIDFGNPMQALERYAGVKVDSWKDLAEAAMYKGISNYS